MVGASPEPMVRLRDNVVISRPIAGSRPRGENEQHDRLLEGELAEDPKELAEHIMLVDLARNDVGRVVRFGTEKVDELMTIERYSHIMHITSQVSGELSDGNGPIDVLRATLPAGTLSGAPKVRAMEIIDELEPTKRGVYGGVVGYIDFSGNLDTAIAIRTMVVTPDGRASVQAGAGIVADSDPQSEDEECAHKAGALLVAVTAAPPHGRARVEAMSDLETEALRHGAGAYRTVRDVLAVRGVDAESYLQGQLSQDLTALAVGGSADSLLLEPDGKLTALLRVTRTDGQGFVLDVDGGYGETVAARLRRFLLRSKVELEPLDWRCLSLRGPAVPEAASGLLDRARPSAGCWRCPSSGTAGRGWTCWVRPTSCSVPTSSRPAWCAAVPMRSRRAALWRACRPWAPSSPPRRSRPKPGVVERTVSFTKGCYTGQELVARIDARGSNVPRRLVGLVAGVDEEPLARGMTLHAGEPPDGDGAADDKVVGTVTSAARSSELGELGRARLPAPQRRGTRPDPAALGRRHRRLPSGPRRNVAVGLNTHDQTRACRMGEGGVAGGRGGLRAGRRGHHPLLDGGRCDDGDPHRPARASWPLRAGPCAPSLSGRPGRHPYRDWIILGVAILVWELAVYTARGSRADHPTFSSMVDAVDRYYVLKAVLFFGWLCVCAFVVRAGTARKEA